jgi:hypothetical protein
MSLQLYKNHSDTLSRCYPARIHAQRNGHNSLHPFGSPRSSEHHRKRVPRCTCLHKLHYDEVRSSTAQRNIPTEKQVCFHQPPRVQNTRRHNDQFLPVFFADTLRWEHLAKYPAVEVVCPPISKSALKDARRDPASADLFREELQKASRRWHKDRVRQKQEDARRDEERRARRQRCFEDCKEKHFTPNTVIVELGGALLRGRGLSYRCFSWCYSGESSGGPCE